MMHILMWGAIAAVFLWSAILVVCVISLRDESRGIAKVLTAGFAVTTMSQTVTDIHVFGWTKDRWRTIEECLKVVRKYDTEKNYERLANAVEPYRTGIPT